MSARAVDWRESYIVCEHIAANQALSTWHQGFRVCCDTCYADVDENGMPRFLNDKNDFHTERRGELTVGWILVEEL